MTPRLYGNGKGLTCQESNDTRTTGTHSPGSRSRLPLPVYPLILEKYHRDPNSYHCRRCHPWREEIMSITKKSVHITYHIDSLGANPEASLSRITRAKGQHWSVVSVDLEAGNGATVLVSVSPEAPQGYEYKIVSRFTEIVGEFNVKHGYSRLARKIGLLAILLVSVAGFTGCASLKPVRVQASYKNVSLALDLEVTR